VILYEALAGQLPCQAKNLGAKIIAILAQPVPDLSLVVPDICPALAAFLRRMLDKDLPQRIRSARLVSAELEAILSLR
jgi:serine/threonine protein kinase